MKVGMVSTFRTQCGVGKYMEELCDYLIRDVNLHIFAETTLKEEEEIDPLAKIPYTRCYTRGDFTFTKMLQKIQEFSPDVVHIQFESSMFNETYDVRNSPILNLLRSLNNLGIKSVMTFHNVIPKPDPNTPDIALIENWYKSINCQVVVGNVATKNEFLKWAPNAKITVIPLGSTIFKPYTKEEASKQLNMPENFTYIVQCGFYGCYDEDTYALTQNGIKTYKELNIGDMVLSLNPETKIIEYSPILDITVSDYNGLMYHFKSRKTDLLVTPNHNMLRQTTTTRKLIFEKANFLEEKKLSRIDLPQGDWKGKEDKTFVFPSGREIDINDFLYIMGLYIGDGHYSESNNVTYLYIPKRDKSRKKVEEVLTRANINWKVWSKRITKDIYFIDNDFKKYFKDCGTYSKDKNIPSYLLQYSSESLTSLMEGLYNSDGDKNQNYYTKSFRLLHDIIELVTKIGKSIHYYENPQRTTTINGRKIKYSKSYSMHISKGNKKFWDKMPFSKKKNEYVTKENYEGIVWCATVKNKNLLVIRNGWATFCGNSDKGMVQSIQALPKVLEKRPNTKLVFAGGLHPLAPQAWKDHTLQSLKEAFKLKLTSNVIFLGKFLTEEQMNLWFGIADVVLVNHHWVSGLYSATASGHRVLASNRPIVMNNTDVRLSEFTDGVQCCKTDDAHLAESIIKCIENKPYAKTIAEGAVKYAQETTFENIAKKHIEVYESVLKK